ncbi:hypothetical protein TSL6_05360 [Sulfurovum sp. TSL6]|uniref:hypothetical protein n=1 Tax=Sulfurovum sp. TSL6 TaxID=2826995 RepID=UPI001CC6C732|nr:hypothetical protein [Sulfurovum sp. TSL6]GIU00030.1 hypothetical protein TSL6_05360 [Sulfurovum sp. TSL6]
MSNKLNKKTETDVTIDLEKRKFIGKCGKYAVGAGMATLMMPTVSSAISSCNNGWGNGDQCAPGNSLPNNNAENNTFGTTQQNFGDPNPN